MRLALLLLALVVAACPKTTDVPTPQPAPATDEAAAIPADGLTLEGTLALPARTPGTPVPGVVLVHGSGPQSRDEVLPGQLNQQFGLEVAVFADLSDALRDRGYAVLRYDKRSCFSGNGCDNAYPTPTADLRVEDFVDDAVAAAQWLDAREDIGPVWVIGHSQGAAFLPAILQAAPGAAGGVSLAGNMRPIDALMQHQHDASLALLQQMGAPQAQVDALLGPLRAILDGLAALRAGTWDDAPIAGLPPAFWEGWLALSDARPALAAAETRPLLALNGDADTNIPADPELDLWAEAGADVVELPCISHALNCVSPTIEGQVSDSVSTAVADWLDAR